MHKLTTVILTVLLGVRFNEGRVSAMLWSILFENKNERLVFNAVHVLTTITAVKTSFPVFINYSIEIHDWVGYHNHSA